MLPGQRVSVADRDRDNFISKVDSRDGSLTKSNLTWNTWWIHNVTLWSREVRSFLNIFILFYWRWRLEGTNLLFLLDSFFIFGGLSGEDSRGHNQINYFVISDYFRSLNSYLQSKSVRAATIIYILWPLNILDFLELKKIY